MDGFVYEYNAMNRKHRMAGIGSHNLAYRRRLPVRLRDHWRPSLPRRGDPRVRRAGSRTQIRSRRKDIFNGRALLTPHAAAYFYREKITFDNLPDPPQPLRQEKTAEPPTSRAEILLKADFEGDLSLPIPRR